MTARKRPEDKIATGRPSKFRPEFVEQASKLAALGATDREAAEFFGVNEATLNRWKHTRAEFCASLKVGKEAADQRVAQSLYRRAVGYSYDAVKIFMPAGASAPVYAPYVEHAPPDTTAAIFWLKNRDPDQWRDVSRTELTGKDGSPIRNETVLDVSALSAAQLRAIASIQVPTE